MNCCAEPLVLTFDMGTQSARAMLVDSSGHIVHKSQIRYAEPYFSRNPGWAEQKADFYWENLCKVSKNLRQKAEECWERIAAVTMTCIRDSCVCVDSEGNPLNDVILWLDKREAVKLPELNPAQKLSFAAGGMTETVKLQRKMSCCNYLKYHQPELWAKTYKFLMLSAYLNFKFTGRFADSCANLIGHIPFDSKARRWMKRGDMRRVIFDVDEDKLYDVYEPGEVIGTITEKASEETGIPAGLNLIATGSDKGCEIIGLGCLTPDKAALSFGTTATVALTTDYYMEPLPFIPAYPAVAKNCYNPEVQIYRGFWLISWFKKEFAGGEFAAAERMGVSVEQHLNSRLKEIPPGCDGLVFQPYFTPGIIMPTARGSIIGISDAHTRMHLYRAIIEGIIFALMDGLRTLERRGRFKVKELFVAGGGAQSDEICQICANMFGLPVNRIQTYEASGLGSSMVAFISLGVHKNMEQAVKAMVRVRDRFVPDMTEHIMYEELFNRVFQRIFPRLLPLFKKEKLIKGVNKNG